MCVLGVFCTGMDYPVRRTLSPPRKRGKILIVNNFICIDRKTTHTSYHIPNWI